MTDQALNSVVNFALSVIIARNVGVREFGAYGVAFTAWVLALGVGRACGSLPLVIIHSGADTDHRRHESAAVGFELLVGVAAGVVCASVGALLAAPVSNAMFGIAVSIPALLTQDACRFVYFRRLQPRSAALNDVVFAASTIVISISIAASPAQHSVFAYLVGWGVAGAATAALGYLRLKVYRVLSGALDHFRDSRSMLGNLIGEFMASVGISQSALYVVVAGSSLSGAGAFRAAQTLIGPLNIFTQGLYPLLLVEGVAVRHRRISQLRPFLAWAGLGLALGSIIYAFLVRLLPDEIGRHLLGASWTAGQALVVPLALVVALNMPAVAAQTGLRALADTRRAFYLRLMVGIPVLAGALVGVMLRGPSGAAWGMVIAAAIGVITAWSYFLVAFRKALIIDM